MISICIPIYNFKVEELVKKLSVQSKSLDVPSEIILIDDCSESVFKEENSSICNNEIYIQLEKNIGRSAIRNLFLKYTKYDYLLFLDCDSIVFTDNFLPDYVNAIKKNPDSVICGGREYPKIPPEKNKLLSWRYGIKKESKSFEIRAQNPNKSFMTNNFVIDRRIFQTIQFNERLVEYGHEDTLFGFELKKRSINIIHIDNPVLNGDIEDNSEYLKKTEIAISNLTNIIKYTEYNEALISDVTLLRIFYKFYKVRKIIRVVFLVLKPLIKYILIKVYANIYLFDFYKLGTLTRKIKSSEHIK